MAYDLTYADFNKFYITRSGCKVKILCNASDSGIQYDYPIIGVIAKNNGEWSSSPLAWSANGAFEKVYNRKCGLDIVGEWIEQEHTKTITIPIPLKQVKSGNMVYKITSYGNIISFMFNADEPADQAMLKARLLFGSREDAIAFLNALQQDN